MRMLKAQSEGRPVNDCGKLLLCASAVSSERKRLQSVRAATEHTAKLLNLDFEMVKFKRGFSQIYVYYANGGEPIPLYCDDGKGYDLQEICAALRNMMFVLSFHPKHPALRQARDLLATLS